MSESPDENPKWSWNGVLRATVLGALLGLLGAVAVDRFGGEPIDPIILKTWHGTKFRAMDEFAYSTGRGPSMWVGFPFFGAMAGFAYRITRNNWQW